MGELKLRKEVCRLKKRIRAIACQCEHTHLEKSASVAECL